MQIRSDAPGQDAQRILDAMMDGVLIISPEGKVQALNQEACRIFETTPGYDPDRTLKSLVPPHHRLLAAVREVHASQRARAEDEVGLARRFGTDLLLDLTLSPLTPEGDEEMGGVIVVIRDRTSLNELRENASERERLVSYGQIAAGIAHEVKNPLGGIRGAAELLEKRAQDERSERISSLIIQEVDRITALVDDLMVFAKGESLCFQTMNLHRLLDQMIELVGSEPMAANVEFERIYDPSIPELLADPGRLTQIFLNLARNSIQAMGQSGGKLRLTTSVSLENRLTGEDGRVKPTVNIIFEDQGPGIEPENLEKLATPFFTTKPDGTGLGLAVSQHWILRHGGRLLIEPHGPEGGARVCVKLPLQTEANHSATTVGTS